MFEDKQLINGLKSGSDDAFNRLYEKYIDDMFSLAFNLLGDYSAAEDVVQDVFINFLQSAGEIRIRANLKGYLLTSIANRSRDNIRQKARRPSAPMDEALKLGSDSAEPIEMAINSEQLQQADKALATLAYEQREAVVLHLCGKLKFRQIAKLQQVPIKTVQSRYRYGINKLRSLLNDEVVK